MNSITTNSINNYLKRLELTLSQGQVILKHAKSELMPIEGEINLHNAQIHIVQIYISIGKILHLTLKRVGEVSDAKRMGKGIHF